MKFFCGGVPYCLHNNKKDESQPEHLTVLQYFVLSYLLKYNRVDQKVHKHLQKMLNLSLV